MFYPKTNIAGKWINENTNKSSLKKLKQVKVSSVKKNVGSMIGSNPHNQLSMCEHTYCFDMKILQQARRITDSRLKPLPKATASLFLCFCACATYAVVKKQMLLNKRTINYKTRQTKLTNLTLPSCLTHQFICLNKKVKKIK